MTRKNRSALGVGASSVGAAATFAAAAAAAAAAVIIVFGCPDGASAFVPPAVRRPNCMASSSSSSSFRLRLFLPASARSAAAGTGTCTDARSIVVVSSSAGDFEVQSEEDSDGDSASALDPDPDTDTVAAAAAAAEKPATLAEMEDMEEKRLADLEKSQSSSSSSLRLSSSRQDGRTSGITRMRNGVVQSIDGGNQVYNEPVEIASSEPTGGADGGDDDDDSPEERTARIDALLEADDREWRNQRRRTKMGRYADATSAEEMDEIAKRERAEIARENERKAKAAGGQGVTLEMLDPLDSGTGTGKGDGSGALDAFSIKGRKTSWFAEVDKELRQEMDAMGATSTDGDGGPTVTVDGRIVSRDKLQGVRVGALDGWHLEIFPGDFVVHRKYGVGRFERTVLQPKTKLTREEKRARSDRREELIREAIEATGKKSLPAEEIKRMMDKFGTKEDKDPISNPQATLLEIAYYDAMVHVPVERAYRLSRYRAGDAVVKPRLSRVKGGAWVKAKQKVEENTIVMAQDVLALYATREALTRPPCDPSLEGRVREFEETFPFEPTPDQFTCFEHVENDMVWRSRPMDRLVCGDVGFGKTEVALRALYRAVANGKQAAMLAPTGVLAAQHFKNVVQRMGEDTKFNVTVGMLRGGMGKNTKAGRLLREKIASGEVDLIVGTHALLGNGMNFRDLALLVIDEEQRFGVKQKERLKVITNGVDVLTLSATPIPRTLQMSLSGVRDTSTIRTPPPMRKPTITMVQEFSELYVQEAIERELARGGQCYYVLPRIADLDEAETMLTGLFPDIRIIQAHGRMGRGAEENVAKFAEGEYDVLLATTVIENGVDIPSVNTIIVQNAQALGMSTLYQLKGRVGRSNVQAHAYFLHKPEAITEQSAMRLQAMADLGDLGSGFDVANRDLEIRGAGSLLGTEQSGMAAKVGFDLYMRMLKKSVRQLRGLDLPTVPRTNVLLPKGEGSIEVGDGSQSSRAFQINKGYIKDPKERLTQESAARLAESTAQLVELTNLWKETYGPIPARIQKQLKTLHLHACTRILGIDLVGMVDSGDGTSTDCVLRSPGLRPRHWVQISKLLRRGVPTKGLDVFFPARFSSGDEDIEISGGKKIDVQKLLSKLRNDEDKEEGWDSLDQEEVEAMKEISSALNVNSMDEIDVENYPRFVVKNLGAVKAGTRIDALLKVLLPASKVVYEKQQADKEKAKVAAELREKRELMKKQQKEIEAAHSRSFGARSARYAEHYK